MAAQPRRAVITGIGVLSPIGMDLTTYWQSLLDGKSGVRAIEHMDVSEFPCRVAATIPGFNDKFARDVFKNPNNPKDKEAQDRQKSLKVMARTIQLGVCAAQFAMKDARMEKGKIDPTRIGVEFGSAIVHTELDDIGRAAKISTQADKVDLRIWGEAGLKEIPPLWMLKYLPNMPSCHVSIQHDMQGPSNTMTVGDVSGMVALGEAYRILNRNLVDFMLVGGTDSKINPLNFVRQSLFQPLTTTHNDSPGKALRPFDRDRDGMVLGEGAAAIGLEELGHAQQRGAKIYAEMCGFASGCDLDHQGKVIAKVIRRAIDEAGITPADIDHVNAHGLGTKDTDLWEAKAIREVFGDRTPVWGLKGFLSSLGPAASVVELIGSILAFENNLLPAMINCDNPDPACGIRVHNRGTRTIDKPYFLKLNLTDIGQTAAVVLRRWEH
jgi:3-oxoacyl-[acyl-carrier-protein] synthase II